MHKVYGHQKLSAEFDAVLNGRAPGYFYRSVHQFGLMLPEEKCLIKATKRMLVHFHTSLFILENTFKHVIRE